MVAITNDMIETVAKVLSDEGADTKIGWHGWRCFDARHPEPCGHTADVARMVLEAVAPLIQAAALRDLADEFETTAIQIVFDDPKSIDAARWDGMETSRKHAIRRIRDRADRIGGRHE